MDRIFSKLGLSKGSLEIQLPPERFIFGGDVEGSVIFALKKPCEGKALWVELKATQKLTMPKPFRVRQETGWRNEIRRSTNTHILYQYRANLDGYHLYDVGKYSFCLPLPTELQQTEPSSEITKAADLIVVAAGVCGLIGREDLKEGVIVIDVGIHRNENGLCGDVRFEEMQGFAKAITPVPGGVGPMTITMLLMNTLELSRLS